MSGNDPKDTDSVETNETDERAETSRRDLLTAGAAAAVLGVTAAVAAPKVAKAQGPGPGVWQVSGTEVVRVNDVSYALNSEIAEDLTVITKAAWDGYTKTGTTIPAADVKADLLSEDYSVVRERMTDITEIGRAEFSPDKPRVITIEMYNNGYVKRAVDELVFVLLPKPDGVHNSKGKVGGSVRALMAAVPFGM